MTERGETGADRALSSPAHPRDTYESLLAEVVEFLLSLRVYECERYLDVAVDLLLDADPPLPTDTTARSTWCMGWRIALRGTGRPLKHCWLRSGVDLPRHAYEALVVIYGLDRLSKVCLDIERLYGFDLAIVVSTCETPERRKGHERRREGRT